LPSRCETENPFRLILGQGVPVAPLPAAQLRSPSRNDAAVFMVRRKLSEGMSRAPLSVPLTAFDASGALEVAEFQRHLEDQVAARPGAVFVCCLPGEFSSLSLTEFEELVRVAAEVAGGRVPVIAGIGHGAALAVEFARAAERAGADAGLVLMSSMMANSPIGLLAHTRAVAAGTRLPLILCHAPKARLADRTVDGLIRIPSVIGVVDCSGDVAQAQRLRLLSPAHWLFINGATTAEMRARPYASIGIPACASAVHAFAPEIARSFFGGLVEGDDMWVLELLREFFLPLTELTRTQQGYSVSLPKAAARLRGIPLGGVRAPLVEPSAKHVRALETILSKGLDLVSQGAMTT
jgi:5-dehydro-4-deoxyglucarate dehydratase